MRTIKTIKTFIKNFIDDSWEMEDMRILMNANESQVKKWIDDQAKELWQEAYIKIDYSTWRSSDFKKIKDAASKRFKELKELDD